MSRIFCCIVCKKNFHKAAAAAAALDTPTLLLLLYCISCGRVSRTQTPLLFDIVAMAEDNLSREEYLKKQEQVVTIISVI